MKKEQFSSKNILQQYRNHHDSVNMKNIDLNVDKITSELCIANNSNNQRQHKRNNSISNNNNINSNGNGGLLGNNPINNLKNNHFRSSSALHHKKQIISNQNINNYSNNFHSNPIYQTISKSHNHNSYLNQNNKNPFTPIPTASSLINQQQHKQLQNNNLNQNKYQMIQLKRHIKKLQNQLKKKLSQHPLWSKFLKASNSSNKMTHLDIYIEYKRIQIELNQQNQRLHILSKEKEQLLKQNHELKQSQQINFQKFTQDVKAVSQTVQKMQKIIQNKDQIIQKLQSDLNKDKKLIKQLNKKISSLNQQLQLQKSTNNMQLIRMKQQQQEDTNQRNIAINQLQNQIKKDEEKIQQLVKQIKKYSQDKKKILIQFDNFKKSQNRQKLNFVEQRNKQIQELKQEYQKQFTRREQSILIQFQKKQNQLEKKLKNQLIINKQMNNKIQSLQSQRDNYINKIQKLEKGLRQNQIKIQSLIFENQSINNNLFERQKYIKKLEFQIQEKQSINIKLSLKINQFQEKLKLENQNNLISLKKSQYQMVTLKQRVQNLNKQLKNNDQQSKKAKKANSQNLKAIGRLIQVVNKLKKLISVNNFQRSYSYPSGEQMKERQMQQLSPIIDLISKFLDQIEKKSQKQYKKINILGQKLNKLFNQDQKLVQTLLATVNVMMKEKQKSEVIQFLIKQYFDEGKEILSIFFSQNFNERIINQKYQKIGQILKKIDFKTLGLSKDFHLKKKIKNKEEIYQNLNSQLQNQDSFEDENHARINNFMQNDNNQDSLSEAQKYEQNYQKSNIMQNKTKNFDKNKMIRSKSSQNIEKDYNSRKGYNSSSKNIKKQIIQIQRQKINEIQHPRDKVRKNSLQNSITYHQNPNSSKNTKQLIKKRLQTQPFMNYNSNNSYNSQNSQHSYPIYQNGKQNNEIMGIQNYHINYQPNKQNNMNKQNSLNSYSNNSTKNLSNILLLNHNNQYDLIKESQRNFNKKQAAKKKQKTLRNQESLPEKAAIFNKYFGR